MLVVLPAPLRPNKPSRRPAPQRNETRCRTWLSPYSASMSASNKASVAKIDLPRARMCHDLAAGSFDFDLAEMQHRDAFGEIERDIHVMLDHDDRHLARDRREQK